MSFRYPKGGFIQYFFDPLTPGALVNFGPLYIWGGLGNGESGNNNTISRSSPVQVGSDSDWSQISGNGSAVVAIRANNTMWSWGINEYGQLGQNDLINRSSPVQIGALTTWSKIFVSSFCIAVKTDGTLWAWGINNYGQIGDNTTVYRSSPVQIGSGTTWVTALACAGASSMAIKTDGTLWAWGRNSNGQLGLNNTVDQSSPVQVGALTNWSKIGGGGGTPSFTVVKTDGTLWSWGNNTRGKLGNGNTDNASSPVQIGALTNWSKAMGGTQPSMYAIKTDGTLWAWGDNEDGELGQNNRTYRSSPVQIGALSTWSDVCFPLALKTDGTLWGWGRNNSGQAGLNDTVSRSSPVQIGAATNWNKISSTPTGDDGMAGTSS